MNLNQITISVSNVERSIQFYQVFGLRLIVKALPRYARFECPQGDATFSLHKVDLAMPTAGTWIYFEVQELDNYVNELLNKGIIFDELPADKPYLWREAKLKDPDGNALVLYVAGVNRKNPPWRI